MRALLVPIGLLAACMPPPPVDAGTPDAPWQRVFEGLPGALLSVWGTAHDDVWIVGEDPGDGPMVMRWDGASFTRKDTGASGTMWWVAGDGRGHVFMSGDDGMVLRYDLDDDAFTTLPDVGGDDLFGILPFDVDDVWVVGVSTIAHWDGAQWTIPSAVDDALIGGLQFYKVWGPATDDLWFVASGDAYVRYVDGAFTRVDLPREGGLFTAHGDDGLTIAVGGFIDGIVVESVDGAPFSDATVDGMPELNGVYVRDGRAAAGGHEGALWLRDDDGWRADLDAPAVFTTNHAVFIDELGAVWAVGGDLGGEPLTAGTLWKSGAPLDDVTLP